eukprot:12688430-Alexandrium_andersonii.AAC.1
MDALLVAILGLVEEAGTRMRKAHSASRSQGSPGTGSRGAARRSRRTRGRRSTTVSWSSKRAR